MKKFLVLLFWLLNVFLAQAQNNTSTFSGAYTPEKVPNVQIQNIGHFVSDPSGMLGTTVRDEINAILSQLRRETTSEIAVALLPSIGESDCQNFAHQLLNLWGVGQSNDNGMVILVVQDQRCISFETGYGMEGIFPDAICKRIQTESMLPFFRENNYDQGVLQGIYAIRNRIAALDSLSLAELHGIPVKQNKPSFHPGTLIGLNLGIGLLLFLFALVHLRKKTISQTSLSKDTQWNALRKNATGWGLASGLFPLKAV